MEIDILEADHFAATVAGWWAERLSEQPALTMVLPTGSTPRPVYAAISDLVAAGHVSFGSATVFLLDEFGGLPPGDPARCDVALDRDLIRLIDLPQDRLHAPDPDAADPAAEAVRFGALVDDAAPQLAMLGIGMNGHIGLNEPGSTLDERARVVELHETTRRAVAGYGATAPTTWGITLGLRELMGCGEVWLLARGAAKADIVRSTVEGAIGPAVPAGYLRTHPKARLILDTAAASKLGLVR